MSESKLETQNAKLRMRSYGCSVGSLLLLTSVAAVMFALFRAAILVDDEPAIPDDVLGSSVILLPICGMLIGHIRFHRVRHIILGGVLGIVVAVLLNATMFVSFGESPGLAVATIGITLGLLVYGVYVRR